MNTAAPSAPMLPVLFRSVTPVNRDQHRKLRLASLPEPLGFVRGTHLLPALVDEFASAARELPIAFLPEGDVISPVFLLGLRPGSNSFVTTEGLWAASYLPAYVRRYPFILADVDQGDPILCIDDRFEALGTEKGEALFDGKGEPTPFLQPALEFAGGFREAGARNAAFIARLRELELLKAVTLDVRSAKAGEASIQGLMVVDEEKLRGLSDAVVLDLYRTGLLPAIHAHLMSLGGVSALR